MDWNPVIPLCQESLPAVFDDSLSYYEAVCKVAGSFNKLVEYVNTSLEGFVDSSQEYTDEAIAKDRVEFDQKAEEEKALLEFRNKKYEFAYYCPNCGAKMDLEG